MKFKEDVINSLRSENEELSNSISEESMKMNSSINELKIQNECVENESSDLKV